MVRHVIVGGGVAGVSCASELCRLRPEDEVVVLSIEKTVKEAVIGDTFGESLEEVEVTVKDMPSWAKRYGNLMHIQDVAVDIDTYRKCIRLSSGLDLEYDDMCVCTGAAPKKMVGEHPKVVRLRDTDSVEELKNKLRNCTKIAVVGNGGIALDLVASIRDVEVYWVVKHGHIGDAFFDAEVGEFLLEELKRMRQEEGNVDKISHRNNESSQDREVASSTTATSGRNGDIVGSSVGPQWSSDLHSQGITASKLHIEFRSEVSSLKEIADGCMQVTLTTGKIFEVDLVVSAIGVDPAPHITWLPEKDFTRAPDGGLVVNSRLQTTQKDVYAAGDCCSFSSKENALWFQMRLWSQAKAMGILAAHCMLHIEDNMASDMPFELFIHVTRFLGKRVVLLGSYNGQGFESYRQDQVVFYSRISGEGSDRNFIRVLVIHGRVQGAICIGNTGLEETMENLILDKLDVSAYGADLLDPSIDIDDIFD